MAKVQLNTPAPNFTLEDYSGRKVALSNYQGTKFVLLVFNRGFV